MVFENNVKEYKNIENQSWVCFIVYLIPDKSRWKKSCWKLRSYAASRKKVEMILLSENTYIVQILSPQLSDGKIYKT